MTTGALIMMISVQSLTTVITGYLFWKVLKTPPRTEPDSFEDNDDLKR